jgi:hypothetical protein
MLASDDGAVGVGVLAVSIPVPAHTLAEKITIPAINTAIQALRTTFIWRF